MLYIEMSQGTREWERWRSSGIGASDSPSILGVSPYQTRQGLLAERLGDGRREATFAMRRGQRLEPVARAEFESRYGEPMLPCCGEHDWCSWLIASFDGMNLFGTRILEVKWPNHEVHRDALAGKVPMHFLVQIQHQLLVSGCSSCVYVSGTEHSSFGEKDRFAFIEVKPDMAMQLLILDQAARFWKECSRGKRSPDRS